MFKIKIKKGVILAAGDGGRLGSLTLGCPKVLLPVTNGEPLITYPIEALVAAGISQIAIVVGYLGDEVIEVLGDGSSFGAELHYIYNFDYLGGNAVSVHKVKNWAQGEPIVLCMGDHLLDRELVQRLLYRITIDETLCVDYTPVQPYEVAEATKVAIDDDGYIKNIGKDLVCWSAVDTGVFLLTKNFFKVLDGLAASLGTNVEMSDAIRFFISQGNRFNTCDVSGCFWMDVDTEEDLNEARR
ncbi:Bifunctional IPC transferase and DIPP synthase [subsurface metagenome]